jgi:methyltransferase family protein
MGLSPERILQVGLGFSASKTLLSPVEIGVLTELTHGPEDVHSLAGPTGPHSRSTQDILDALVALGFLKRVDGEYFEYAGE